MNYEYITLILSSGVVLKILDILWDWIRNKRKKKSTLEIKIDDIIRGLRSSLRDRIKHLCKVYLERELINTDEHEDLLEMHKSYHQLGGNGHLDFMIDKVNKLKYK